MFIVALTELKDSLDAEATHLAALLGVSAYDVKSRIAGPLPKILLQTANGETARRVCRGIAARGHGALALDASTVVAATEMVSLHRFELDEGGMSSQAGDRLAWSDLGVVVVAGRSLRVARTTEETQYQSSLGGRRPNQVTREVTRAESSTTHSAYFFPNAHAASRRPWVLDEATAQFSSLGPSMQPTRRANFHTTISKVRQLAPGVVIDDRFVAAPLAASETVRVRDHDSVLTPAGGATADLLVNVLAAWLMRAHEGPYRSS
jgi:hypothetical protein